MGLSRRGHANFSRSLSLLGGRFNGRRTRGDGGGGRSVDLYGERYLQFAGRGRATTAALRGANSFAIVRLGCFLECGRRSDSPQPSGEHGVKILVRATNWVGDAVMAIPALETIRKRWARAEIVVLAASWVADLYRGQGYADRLIIYEGQDNGKHRSMLAKEGVAAELRRENFDVAVLLQNAIDAAWIVWRAHIPQRIGYAREARGWMLTHPVAVPRPGDTPPHEAYYYLELLRRAGWIAQLPRVEKIELHVGTEARERGEERLAAAGARRKCPRVALAPGAAFGSAKCWPPERYAALADRLIAECEADVILFGAPQEREMATRIAEGMSRPALNLA